MLKPLSILLKLRVAYRFDGWQSHVPKSQHETFRWMMEEYRVQVFAQELGTAQPVSVKRLQAMWV